jgi:dodecin
MGGQAMAVARVTKIIGSSPRSWQAAADEAVKRANKTLRGVTGIHVIEQKAHVEKGKVTEYRTTVEVTFILD